MSGEIDFSKIQKFRAFDPFQQGFYFDMLNDKEKDYLDEMEESKEPEFMNVADRDAETKRLKSELEENGLQSLYEKAVEKARLEGHPAPVTRAEAVIKSMGGYDYLKKEEEKKRGRIRELEYYEDVKSFGREKAQEAFEKSRDDLIAQGAENSATPSLIAGQKVLDEYNAMASKGRNDLYYYRVDQQIAEHEKVTQNPDFSQKAQSGRSVFIGGKNAPGSLLTKEILDIINENPARNMYSGTPGYLSPNEEKIRKLTENEKNVMRYYAKEKEYDKIDEYYNALERYLNARVQKEKNELMEQWAYENPILGAGLNIASNVGTPLAFVGNGGQWLKNAITGKYEPTDMNTAWFAGTHMLNATEDGVAQRAYDAAEEYGLGEEAEFLTRGALDIAGDIVDVPLGKMGTVLSVIGNAGEKTHEALERGAEPGDALFESTVKRAISGVTGDLKHGKIAEAILSEILLGKNSDYNRRFADLKKEGMSDEEAREKAMQEVVWKTIYRQLGNDAFRK